jgi:serine/threonine protein phosphatase PrpC
MPKDFNLHFCSRSHTGKVKRNNEDYLRIHQDGLLAAIADGMGELTLVKSLVKLR